MSAQRAAVNARGKQVDAYFIFPNVLCGGAVCLFFIDLSVCIALQEAPGGESGKGRRNFLRIFRS